MRISGGRVARGRDFQREVVVAVEVCEPFARGFEAETESLALGGLRSLSLSRAAAVAHGQREVFAVTFRGDRHQARPAVTLDAVPDRVLDKRLQHQCGHKCLREQRIESDLSGEAVLEPQTLDRR